VGEIEIENEGGDENENACRENKGTLEHKGGTLAVENLPFNYFHGAVRERHRCQDVCLIENRP
jgi:hypothetical protein